MKTRLIRGLVAFGIAGGLGLGFGSTAGASGSQQSSHCIVLEHFRSNGTNVYEYVNVCAC